MRKEVRVSPIYIGVFLTSLSTLVLEISLTRLLSVSKWYHFAFMVVSMALFGIGASGSFLSVCYSLLEKDVNKLLFTFSGLFSLSCVASLVITNHIPFDPFRFSWDRMQILYLLIYYVVLAVPFFFSGSCVAVVLSKMAKKVNKLYFSDLMGAGLGSLLVTLISILSVSSVIVFASLLGALSTFFFSLNLSKRRSYFTLLWVLILIVFLFNEPILSISISPYKSLKVALTYPDSELLFTQWNAFSRVDVIKSPYVRYAPGLSYEYRKPLPPQLGITVDGNGLNAITYYDGNLSTLEFTNFLPMSLAYQLYENPNVLIFGSGGGLDILIALYNNAKSIVAIDINPIIVDVVKNKYRDFSGNIYENEKVRVEIIDGRSFVRSSDTKYDIIQLSLTDNVAASSTGIYALSENYVYTTEAFEDYYTHLSANGVLSVTRWLLPPPREEIRVVSLAISALEGQGVHDPENHIAVIRSWGTITFLLKKSAFTQEETNRIKEFCRERKFDIVYVPGVAPSEVNIYNKFPEEYYYLMIHNLLFSEDRARFYEDYLFNVSPMTDDRPFFFHFFKWDKIIPLYESMGRKWQPFIEGGYLVPVILVQALILSIVFIFLPVYVFKKTRSTFGKWRMLGYFSCLGVGYMFIEIALIQKFILFLGHPVYSISVVLCTLLTFSGVGSFFSERFNVKAGKILVPIISILSVMVVSYLTFLPNLFHLFLGQRLLIRGLISMMLIAPLGFVMGIPFPTGIKLVNSLNPNLISWVWSINGCSSVLGSILPVIIALSFGFSTVLALGSVAYLAGLPMILSLYGKIE